MKPPLSIAGLAVLAAAWLGPLPAMAAGGSFAAHMVLHMLVVAVAPPLIAIGCADRLARLPLLGVLFSAPLLASLVDFFVIWGWHVPLLHQAARADRTIMTIEQGSFLFAGLLVWISAFAGRPEAGRADALIGAAALFFTSMHMTLLGALISLGPRAMMHSTAGPGERPFGLTVLQDQQLGGVVMLAVGGASYLIGGLMLVARVLRPAPRGSARATVETR